MPASYATTDDFIQAFGSESISLSNLDNPSTGTISTATLQRMLDDGAAEMDSYLIRAISAPTLLAWKANPSLAISQVKRRNMDIARYLADRLEPREDVVTRYKMAIQWLKDVANKVVDLGIAPEPDVGNSGGITVDAATSVLADGSFAYGFGNWMEGGSWR